MTTKRVMEISIKIFTKKNIEINIVENVSEINSVNSKINLYSIF